MEAIIISIGNELLNGTVVDTNSTYIGKQLTGCGIKVREMLRIGDFEQDMMNAVTNSLEKADIIVTTGGLGPTSDDITRPVLIKLFKSEVKLNNEVYDHIKSLFSRRNYVMPDININQAMLPVDAKVIFNHSGTAPGLHFEKNGKHIFTIPGVPYESRTMTDNYIVPLVKKLSKFHYRSLDINTFGIGEGSLFIKVDYKYYENLGLDLAFLPSPSGVKVRISKRDTDLNKLNQIIETAKEKLIGEIGEYIIGYGNSTLAESLIDLLKEKKFTVSFAESCTGGMCAAKITDIPGSSAVFNQSYVTYSNEVKHKILGVCNETLEKFGAVSKETVSEMLDGMLSITDADIVGAISGIAGPDGGTEEKPVGTVYVGVKIRGQEEVIQHFLGWGQRGDVRERSVNTLFFNMIKQLKEL